MDFFQILLIKKENPFVFCDVSSPPGANVNKIGLDDSPLHVAARLSSPELVLVLLDHGADRHLTNAEGKRPADLTPANSPAGRLLEAAGGTCGLTVRRAVWPLDRRRERVLTGAACPQE